ncbi:MAG: DUF3375 family protein [Verrucomicrobiota bacterium]
MNYTELQLRFKQSPTLRLLRAENAPLVLAVLFTAFKREHHAVAPESRMRALLEAEIEELRDVGDFASGRPATQALAARTQHDFAACRFIAAGHRNQEATKRKYAYQAPGMAEPVCITTRPEYFDEHSDSLELWPPGCPAFPISETAATPEELADVSIPDLLNEQIK